MFSSLYGTLVGSAREDGGRGAGRYFNFQLSISNFHLDVAIRCGLGASQPFDAFARLRVYEEVLVAGLLGVTAFTPLHLGRANMFALLSAFVEVGTDASEGLVEPDADAVVAVVYTAAILLAGTAAVPRLPSCECVIVGLC